MTDIIEEQLSLFRTWPSETIGHQTIKNIDLHLVLQTGLSSTNNLGIISLSDEFGLMNLYHGSVPVVLQICSVTNQVSQRDSGMVCVGTRYIYA